MKEKILVVDDGQAICDILQFNLSNEGYVIDCAYSAEEALQILTPQHSLILLDVMMGGMSGYKMAEKLRRDGNQIPIIFLTAKDTENDMLTGFSVGADDYISKPFSVKEVIARVRAILKRTGQIEKNKPATKESIRMIIGNLIIDGNTKEMTIDNRLIPLTRTEFDIVMLLASHPDRVYERGEIIDLVWKNEVYVTERTVDVHIGRLRKKMGKLAALIVSRPGYGYRFNYQE